MHLVEIAVVEATSGELFVLRVRDQAQRAALKPEDVRFKHHLTCGIKTKTVTASGLLDHIARSRQRPAECPPHELLEHLVDVDDQPTRTRRAGSMARSRMAQDDPSQLDGCAVMPVQRRPLDARWINPLPPWQRLNMLGEGRQNLPHDTSSQNGVGRLPKCLAGGDDELVLQDVLSVLVVGDLDGHQLVIMPPELLVDQPLSAHHAKRRLASSVPLQYT